MAIGLEKGKIYGVCVCLGRKGYCMRHGLRQVIAPQSLLHRDGETRRACLRVPALTTGN